MEKHFGKIMLSALFLLIGVVVAHAQYPKYIYGIASWYGEDFRGKKTASGEKFNPDKLTCAHKTLPFGTILEVENVENKKKVTVRVNDRGPFSGNRILDLSEKAAEQLDFIEKGTTYVRVTLVKLGDNKPVADEEEVKETKKDDKKETVKKDDKKTVVKADEKKTVKDDKKETVKKDDKKDIVIEEVKKDDSKPKEKTVVKYVTVTNRVDVKVTNIINVPPYEEKIIEKRIDDFDAFIIDEPSENAIISPIDKKKDMSYDDLKESIKRELLKELELEKNKKDYKVNITTEKEFDFLDGGKEITPDVLISNTTVYDIENREMRKDIRNEIDKMLDKEPRYITNIIEPKVKGISYVIQVGAFVEENKAINLYNLLKSKGYSVFTSEVNVKGKRYIRVRIGFFNTVDEANRTINKLKDIKLGGMVIKVDNS